MSFFQPYPATPASSGGFSVAAHVRLANPFARASYSSGFTEVVASTPEQWGGFLVSAAAGSRGIIVVGIGAAGSEVIIASLPLSMQYGAAVSYYVPIPIAAGQRVSIAVSAATSASVTGQIVGFAASGFSALPTFSVLECGPFDLDGGFGDYGKTTVIDPGGTANTMPGSYTEISLAGTNTVANNQINGDSLANSYDWFGFTVFDGNNSATSQQERLWDLATGAAASEVDFATGLYDEVSSGEYNLLPGIFWMPGGMAAGTRISARMQCSIIDATDRLGGVYLFGLR